MNIGVAPITQLRTWAIQIVIDFPYHKEKVPFLKREATEGNHCLVR